jgi:hypothetical protein
MFYMRLRAVIADFSSFKCRQWDCRISETALRSFETRRASKDSSVNPWMEWAHRGDLGADATLMRCVPAHGGIRFRGRPVRSGSWRKAAQSRRVDCLCRTQKVLRDRSHVRTTFCCCLIAVGLQLCDELRRSWSVNELPLASKTLSCSDSGIGYIFISQRVI